LSGAGEGVESADAVAGGGGDVRTMAQKTSVPDIERMHPETLMRGLLILMAPCWSSTSSA
jgi:hypothetical protein